MSDQLLNQTLPVFEDLPEVLPNTGPREGQWPKRLSPLMDRPNEWARVWEFTKASYASRTATGLKKGQLKKPAGEWEFTSRTVDGRHYLYARYLGTGNGKRAK